MNCKKCGFILTNENPVCPSCGEPNEFYNGGVSNVTPTPVVETPVTPVAEPTPVVPTEPVAPATPVEPVAPVVPETPVAPVVEPTPVVQPEPIVQPAPVAPLEQTMQPKAPITPIADMGEQTAAPAAPVAQKKNNKLTLILTIILVLVVLGAAVFIGMKYFDLFPKTKTTPEVEPKKEEKKEDDSTKVDVAGYTFTLPKGFTELTPAEGINLVGNTNFFFQKNAASTIASTYDEILASKDAMTEDFKIKFADLKFFANGEETYADHKYFIFRFIYGENNEYIFDIIYTELPDNTVFSTGVDYVSNYKDTGYGLLSSFIESGKVSEDASVPTSYEPVYDATIRPLLAQ